MVRNNTGFWLHYSAYNAANNAAEPGDVANHALQFVIDGVVSTPNNSPQEIAVGEYRILVDAAESNGAKFICVAGISSTVDVYIIPGMVITDLLISGVTFVACYTAWDVAANAPKTGDVLNHTMTVAQDNTNAGATNAPAEINALSLPGLHSLSVTAGEGAGHAVSVIGVSATADVNIIPTEIAPFTVDYPVEADVKFGTDYAEGTLTGTLSPFDATYLLPEEIILEDEEIIIFEGCD
jgi:hypothetical protein